jgi:mxaK protein
MSGTSPATRQRPRTGWARRVFVTVYAARVVFVWVLLAGALAVAVASGWTWAKERRDNATIAALLAGEDVTIDPERASSPVLFARAYYLLKRDRIDEAQVLLDQANFRGDPKVRILMLYDAANTRLRAAFDAIERGRFDKATSLVNLAKDDYNQALRLDPQAWDVKYNLDVAARLVRDLPQIESSEESQQQEPPKTLWTDLPGVPKGAP